MRSTDLTPKVIEVGFYYNQKPHYKLHFEDYVFEEISLNGILTFLEGLGKSELQGASVSFWDRDSMGMKKVWACDGEYFMKNHKIKQLDKHEANQ